MDEKYDVSERVQVVPVERVISVSARSFEEVVAGIYSGLGRPDNFAALVQCCATADDAESFDAAVAESVEATGDHVIVRIGTWLRTALCQSVKDRKETSDGQAFGPRCSA
jgi:hypothetical protein